VEVEVVVAAEVEVEVVVAAEVVVVAAERDRRMWPPASCRRRA
jgi:hypothetical protein